MHESEKNVVYECMITVLGQLPNDQVEYLWNAVKVVDRFDIETLNFIKSFTATALGKLNVYFFLLFFFFFHFLI